MLLYLKIRCIFQQNQMTKGFLHQYAKLLHILCVHGLSTCMGTGPPYQGAGGCAHAHAWGWEHHIKMGIGVPCDAPAVTFAPLTNISRCTATWENSGFYRPCALCLRSVAILLSPSILPETHSRINH